MQSRAELPPPELALRAPICVYCSDRVSEHAYEVHPVQQAPTDIYLNPRGTR